MSKLILFFLLCNFSLSALANGVVTLGGSYIAKNKNTLDSMWGMGPSLSGYSQEIYMKPSASIHLDYQSMPKNSLGYGFGFIYDLPRKFKKVRTTADGITVDTYILGSEKLTTQSYLMNFYYRFERFYLTFGLNYLGAKLKSDETNFSGGIGVHWGFGYILSARTSFFLLMRSNEGEYTTQLTADDGYSGRSGTVNYTMLNLGLNFVLF